MGLLDHILQLPDVLGLVEDPGLDLVGAAPVGDGVEVIGQRGVTKELGFLVLGILGEGEGVVGGCTAEKEKSSVAEVLSELGLTGGGGGGGTCAERAGGGRFKRVFRDGRNSGGGVEVAVRVEGWE